MEIKVLGTGCAKCKKLEELTRNVVAEMGVEATIEKVEDIYKIMQFGVMRTPGLVVNGKVVLSGKLPGTSELKELLENA
ncbi:thioredoxin family protein [Maribellus sp. YY47]|uniref:thioredoxin family protein n=1 Tax=Maribellus sp. YY47 TaxID=2929486 RepID=UPI002000C4DA|nr:thioredoxin family protein [Maribellus sp. YY47]MCK3685026.1 thioredoxin family protein [Maribellus sp. YY47]